MNTVKEYDARVDAKRRVTLRGTNYSHYRVRVFEDGRIELRPQELVEISEATLKMMDNSMETLNKGKAGKPVDLSEFED